jgi:DNA primase
MTVIELLDKKKIYYQLSGNDCVVHCLNPEHDDSHPSMRIDKVLGLFNCLSCGYKGNIFHYFGEKINKLDTAREQLKRKIQIISSNSIGLKIPVNSALVSEDYRVSLKTLQTFEAFRNAESDYKDRIMFPIRDLKEKIVCLIGRSEDLFEKAKKYKIFPPGASVPLFPLHKVEPEQGRVILVEGLFDMLNLYNAGYRNALCTFGTNTLNKEKLELLKIIGVSGIDIIFDPDDAGQKAAEIVKEMAEDLDFQTRNINLKIGDPGSMSMQHAINLRKKLYD